MAKIISVNKRTYPSSSILQEVTLVAVLVAGDADDYACYVGHGPEEWVQRFGNKVSFEEACRHFPGGNLVKEKYRR